MIESFVDLTYRGLALGRRIKLTSVRPTTGYLELPMPMPVGTLIAINTDEGVQLEATVAAIHEQVGGSDRVPGMIVKPSLADEAAGSWWKARVSLPEEAEPRPPERSRPITVRPRTHTVPGPTAAEQPLPPSGERLAIEVTETKELSVFVAEQPQPPPLTKEVTETKELSVFVAEQEPARTTNPGVVGPQYEEPPERVASPGPTGARGDTEASRRSIEDIKRTTVMNAVDQELLAKLTTNESELESLTRRTGEHEIVDDGKRTMVMDTVDPSSLGIEVSASGSFKAQTDDGDDDDKPSSTKTPPGGTKKKKKRR